MIFMKLFISHLAILFFVIGAAGQQVSKVGIRHLDLVDEGRQNWTATGKRPLATTVWYPAAADATVQDIDIKISGKSAFISGRACPDAEISNAAKKYPLVLLSHGTGGSGMTLMWLGQYLAERGYIVAAVDHHGNTASEPKYQAQGFILWWERATDLSVALDKLLADKTFGPRIDNEKIGAMGFSLGGTTVVSIGGGVFALDGFRKFCASPERDATCGSQPEFADAMKQFEAIRNTDPIVIESLKYAETSHRDRRIKAVFAIAPALGYSFTRESLAKTDIPFAFVVGEADQTAPAKTNAQKLAEQIKGSKITILPGKAAHYTMLSECTDFGKSIMPICVDDPAVNRHEVHQQVGDLAYRFFEAFIRNSFLR